MSPETTTSLLATSNQKTLFQVFAVLFLLFGVYTLFLFVMLIVASHGAALTSNSIIAVAMGYVLLLVTSGCCLLAGFGLITRKSWGRLAAIFASAITLLSPFLGTLMAIVILILLFTAGSKRHYAAYVAAATV